MSCTNCSCPDCRNKNKCYDCYGTGIRTCEVGPGYEISQFCGCQDGRRERERDEEARENYRCNGPFPF